MKQSITIEINIPDVYEYVDFRPPVNGEYFMNPYGSVVQFFNHTHNNSRIIIKKEFKWPDWLKAYCITKDENGDWFGNLEDAIIVRGAWISNGFNIFLDPELLDIELPEVDWKESKIINPKYRISNDNGIK
jgi:hypothetical protein